MVVARSHKRALALVRSDEVPTHIDRTDDGAVTITRIVYQLAPDELIPSPFGLEEAAARALVRSGRLRAVKLGRRLYARRSDVLALVDAPPCEMPAASDASYDALVARSRAR